MFWLLLSKQLELLKMLHVRNNIGKELRKYISNKINPNEFNELKGYINVHSGEELMPVFKECWEEVADQTVTLTAKDKQLLMRIRQRIPPDHTIGWQRKALQIAASIAIILLTGISAFLYTSNREMSALNEQSVTVKAGKGERLSITLPDGTLVRLNSESELSYKQSFGLKNRMVSLSGEGYFDVTKNTGKVFVVNTEYLDIQVMGTSFNVFAYENKDFIEMALVEGSVNVSTLVPPFKTVKVHPNQKVLYDKIKGDMVVKWTSNELETAWVSKSLAFRSEPLKTVLARIERKYGVTFKVNNSALLNDSYTGAFDQEEIEEVLYILKKHYGFMYQLKGNEITIF